MNLTVDASDLVKWGRYLNNIPRVTKAATARALNAYGQGVLDNIVRIVSSENGWDPDSVRQRVIISQADPQHLEFDLDATLLMSQNQNWNRPFDQRDSTSFDQDTLVNLVTSGDNCVCPVCEQAAEDGPYTMQQLNDMQAKWADYVPPTPNIAPGIITNLVHPRCRCVAQPFNSYRRLPVNFPPETAGGTVGSTPPQQLTPRALAKLVATNLGEELAKLKIMVE